MKTKVKKKYIYEGLGFPIELHNVEMAQIGNEWHPIINVKEIADEAIESLIVEKKRLSGNQISFIRSYFKLSLREFGKNFGESHTAVKKWEDCKSMQTKMDVNIEAMIRLFIFNQIFKSTKENKIRFYDKYTQITDTLYQ